MFLITDSRVIKWPRRQVSQFPLLLDLYQDLSTGVLQESRGLTQSHHETLMATDTPARLRAHEISII